MSGRREGGVRQIPMELPPVEQLHRDDFVSSASNRPALDLVERWPDWPGRTGIVSGPPGCGKSHLLAIWRARSGARLLRGAELSGLDPLAVGAGNAAVDDVAPGMVDERALFHLLNAVQERGGTLLLACPVAPAMAFALPDLGSRLRAAVQAEIGLPDDALVAAVLTKLFADRQIAIEPDLVRYLCLRMERSLAAARHLVQRLDRESLALARPITRALAARVLDVADAAGRPLPLGPD